MTLASRISQTRQSFRDFAAAQDGAMTAFAMLGFLTGCVLAGLAVDVTNLHRQKEHLTIAADAAAQAGIIALSQKMAEQDIKAAALAAAEQNAPADFFGKTSTGIEDVRLVRFDPTTRKLIEGTPNAVQVILHRDESVENPVRTGFLRLAGFEEFNFTVESVAYFGQPKNCSSSDGMYAKGEITLTSGNHIGETYCVHSQTSVWMPQQNTFASGAGVSMPDLSVCKDKCFDSANPGIEDAKFEQNLNLPPVAEHIANVKAAMLATTSVLKTEFFADKSLSSNLSLLADAKVMNTAATKKLVKGSVVDLTAAQYNELMVVSSGRLPEGLVYNVDCRDHGNGPASSISIGGGVDRKNSTLPSSAIETVSQVALITDCAFDVGRYARIDAALAISTKISSSSVLNADEGASVGDPLKNCDLSRKVYFMTMSGVSVNSNFTASNVALIVNGDINIAANSASTEVEHNGTSLHAEGSIQIPSNHIFNACAADGSGLMPSMKTIKFVIPRA
jgi:hypothetical protein